MAMNYLHNDAIACIIDKLEYFDILNLSETCKRFESIRSFVIFREKKHSFHDFNRKIKIGNGYKSHYIWVDGNYIAEIKRPKALNIKCHLWRGFFISLGYTKVKIPFTWPFYLWEKIKYRFPNFNIIEIRDFDRHKCYDWTFTCNDTLQLVFIDRTETDKYFFNQIQMLYHVFQYFKKDIIKITK